MSTRPITLGILGGGQLALMLSRAASQLGVRVRVLDPAESCPAKQAVAEFVQSDFNTLEALLGFARGNDVLTLENEFVDAALLAELEARGHVVLPGARTMAMVQDKLVQKQTLSAAGLQVVEFQSVSSEKEAKAALQQLGLPCVLKRRTLGYDGTGNATVACEEELASAAKRLGGYQAGLYLEKWCPFVRELAVMVARGRAGETAVYPVVETRQSNHVCSSVLAPAQIPKELADAAQEMALGAIEAVSGIGSFGVEFFLTEEGQLLINEMAPRVHNSGHYTLEACDCSQFENHIRAVLGLPLGRAALRSPAAMVNLLAKSEASGVPHGLSEALAVPGAGIHLYGKEKAAPGRKMGHVTALGSDVQSALATAQAAADQISFKSL